MIKGLVGGTLLLAAVAVSSAVRAQQPSPSMVIVEAERIVRERAFDPDAIKFKAVFAHKAPGKFLAACGLVNGKNRFGGYTGYKHFVSAGVPNLTFTEDEVKDFRSVWNGLCVR